VKRLTARLGTAVAALGLALSASACNLNWSPYAAKVGSATITTSQLNDAVAKAASDRPFTCLLQQGGQTHIVGAGAHTYDSGFVAFVLNELINARIGASAARAAHVPVSSLAYSFARTQVAGAFTTQLASARCAGSSSLLLKGLNGTLTPSFVSLMAEEDAIAAHAAHVTLTDAGIQHYEVAHPAATQQNCLVAIAVASKATAGVVERELRNGASFSSLVTQYDKASSLVPPTGQVGCGTLADLANQPTIASAVAKTAVGHVTSPISLQGQYVILEVSSRPYVPVASALEVILTAETGVLKATLSGTERRESVQLDARYGTWRLTPSTGSSGPALNGQVVPPTGPPAAFLLNQRAVYGPATSSPAPSIIPGQGQG
jgi:hypothetical protein